jgi:hypothetical protein
VSRVGFMVAVVLGLAVASPAAAQRVEITPFAGWQFWGKLSVSSGDLVVPSGLDWGVMADIRVADNGFFEFFYSRQETELQFKEFPAGVTSKVFDMAVEYFQVGGQLEFYPGAIQPFTALTLGVTQFNPKADGLSSEWRFSGTIAGGGKFYLTKNIGVRGQGQLLMTFINSSGGMFCSSGSGCFGGVTGQAFIQGNFTAGLVLAF